MDGTSSSHDDATTNKQQNNASDIVNNSHGVKVEVDIDKLRLLSEQNQKLQAALAASKHYTNTSNEQVLALANMSGALLEAVWNEVPTALRTSEQSAIKAEEVFQTPELLEMVLSNLGAFDLLAAQQVGVAWRDGINGSLKLQRLMMMIPDEKAHFSSPFLHPEPEQFLDLFHPSDNKQFLRLYIDPSLMSPRWSLLSPEQRPTWERQRLDLTIRLDLKDIDRYPQIGSRCRDMLICQPPLKKAWIEFAPPFGRKIKKECISEQGLTVGDLVDSLCRDVHERCTIPESWEGRGPFRAYCVSHRRLHIEVRDDDPAIQEEVTEQHRRWKDGKASRKEYRVEWRNDGNEDVDSDDEFVEEHQNDYLEAPPDRPDPRAYHEEW